MPHKWNHFISPDTSRWRQHNIAATRWVHYILKPVSFFRQTTKEKLMIIPQNTQNLSDPLSERIGIYQPSTRHRSCRRWTLVWDGAISGGFSHGQQSESYLLRGWCVSYRNKALLSSLGITCLVIRIITRWDCILSTAGGTLNLHSWKKNEIKEINNRKPSKNFHQCETQEEIILSLVIFYHYH